MTTARWLAVIALMPVIAVVIAAGAESADAQSTTPIDGIVAIVGGHTPSALTDVVLRSDVELRARLALAARSQDTPSGPLSPDLLAATLDQIIGEIAIAREAERLRASDPTDAQIARQRDEIARSVGGEERLERLRAVLSIDPGEIAALASRRAFVDAFLRANLEGSTLVSDAQVEQAYTTLAHPFVDRPLDEVREPLRAWLAAAALERDVRRWIEVLRSRTPIRIVVPFAAGDTAGEEDEADVGSRRE